MTLKMKKSMKLRDEKMEEQYKIVRAWFAYVVRMVKRKTKTMLAVKSLTSDISNHYQIIMEDVQDMIKDNGRELCESVFNEVEDEMVIEIEDKKKIIDSILQTVITGALYKTSWTLKKASEEIIKHLDNVVSGLVEHGIEMGKEPVEIIEEVLQVVDPDNRYQKSYDGEYITRIDGETQRLVRTTVEHIFQEAFVEVAERVSEMMHVIVKIRWISMLSENTCELCESRHNELYDPPDLPLEHPNGQCEFWLELHWI